ncbi:AAT-domain-containing protein, variant 2 [Balamuthia mandrillaris]
MNMLRRESGKCGFELLRPTTKAQLPPIPFYHVKGGTAEERGLRLGRLLKDKIAATIQIYKRTVFQGRSEESLLAEASSFHSVIHGFKREYCQEMEGIARGAEVDLRWVYALNCRTELMNTFPKDIGECSTICFPSNTMKEGEAREGKNPILAQNWDWMEEMQEHVVVVLLEKEEREGAGKKILMVTEPGIIGKIGVNNHGLAVTLNFLRHQPTTFPEQQVQVQATPEGGGEEKGEGERSGKGVPIHMLLRAALECETVAEWEELVVRGMDASMRGTSSAILACDALGHALHLEFAGPHLWSLPPSPIPLQPPKQNKKKNTGEGEEAAAAEEEGKEEKMEAVHWRTNHYLSHQEVNLSADRLQSSLARHARMTELLHQLAEGEQAERFCSEETVMRVLRDGKQEEEEEERKLPILRPFVYDSNLGGKMGTVCHVVMHLGGGRPELKVSRGFAAKVPSFQTFSFE